MNAETKFEITTPEEMQWEEDAQQEQYGQEENRFKIDSPDLADWAFKKVRDAQKQIAELEEFAERQKEKIDQWLEAEKREPESQVQFMENHLIRYYRELQAEDPKAKLTTPNGKVTSRRRQPKWTFNDERTIEYLKQHAPDKVEEVVQTKYNKTEIKKMLQLIETEDGVQLIDENGQLLDIAEVVPQEPTYKVEAQD